MSDATEEMVERIIQDTVNIYPEIHIIVGVLHYRTRLKELAM